MLDKRCRLSWIKFTKLASGDPDPIRLNYFIRWPNLFRSCLYATAVVSDNVVKTGFHPSSAPATILLTPPRTNGRKPHISATTAVRSVNRRRYSGLLKTEWVRTTMRPVMRFSTISGRCLVLALLAVVAVMAFSEPKNTKRQHPSDTRQRVWAIRVGQFVKEPHRWTAVEHHETQALAFSPDGKRLAVTLTHHQRVSEKDLLFNTYLLIFE